VDPHASHRRDLRALPDDQRLRSLDRVADAMKEAHFEIIATNLSKDQEQKLREAFGQR